MKKYLKLASLIALLNLNTGCVQPVGGECRYSSFPAIATIQAHNQESTRVTFLSKFPPHKYESDIQPIDIPVGESVPAKIQEIIEGSCTPLMHSIEVQEYKKITATTLSIPREGLLAKETHDKIIALANDFHTLQGDYPHATLHLHGYTNQRKSDEYSYNLGLRFTQRIKNELIKEGVSAESILMFSHGRGTIAELSSFENLDRVSFKVELHY